MIFSRNLIKTFFNRNLSASRRHVAMTLAEILITLGIVGIIAELTIPTLVTNINKQVNITRWKKTYSTFAQAYLQLYGSDSIDWVSNAAMRDSFASYFKIIKTCPADGGCWHAAGVVKTLKTNDGSQYTASNFGLQPGFIANDGEMVVFLADNYRNGWIVADVNGNQKPNILGVDIFGIRFNEDGKAVPFSQNEFGTCNPPAASTYWSNYEIYIGLGCSQYYIVNN